MKFKAKTNDNRRLDLNWASINALTERSKPDTWYDVEITRKQKKKSDPLRRYYFAVVLPGFMEELGYEKDEELLFHFQLKVTYFQNEPNHEIYQDERGMWRNVPSVFGNKSDIDVSVKKEFVDWCIRKAAHYGVYTPDPGE